jgi:hypothetical protein
MKLIILFLTFVSTNVMAAMYLNSSETQCNGSDPSVVMCDDFEDGDFYAKNCDEANFSGGLLQTDGWCGSVWARVPQLPTNGASCGNAGASGTNCAADSGPLDGTYDEGNSGSHNLGPNITGYNEIYVRYYYRPAVGQKWGQHKHLTFNDKPAGSGGIRWGCFSFNCGTGSPSSTAKIFMGIGAEDVCQAQNTGNDISIIGGHWYLMEMRMKLNSVGAKDGTFQMWMDDCGTTGTACTGPQTLRISRVDNVYFGKVLSTETIRQLWWENWSPGYKSITPIPTTGRELYDQIVVATRKIGPMGVMTPISSKPAAPKNLRAM